MDFSQYSEMSREENSNDHYARLGKHAAFLWKRNVMSDVTVVIGDRQFQAHRAVLTCYSPFLKRNLMRTEGTNNGERSTTIQLTGLDPESFHNLLEYMYTGKLKLGCRNIAKVYLAAKKLEMTEAIRMCAEILAYSGKEDATKTLCQYVASRHRIPGSESHLAFLRDVVNVFEEVIRDDEFLNLTLDEVIEILSQNTIGARNEVVVFLGAISWLQHEMPTRVPFAMRLMECVRFPLMNPDEILLCHYPKQLQTELLGSPGFKELMFTGLFYSTARQLGVQDCFYQYGCSPRTYGASGEKIKWDISMNDVSYRSPSEQDLAATRIQATMKGFLTRQSYRKILDTRERAARTIQSFWRAYIVRKMFNRWGKKPAIPEGSAYKEDANSRDPLLHQLLYHEFGRRLTSGHMSSPMKEIRKGKWPLLLPTEGCLLALGGINPTEPQDANIVGQMVLRYIPSSNLWEKLETMPVPRHHHCAVYLQGDVYIIGGCDPRLTFQAKMVATKDVFKLDVTTGQWSPVCSMLQARLYHGAAELDGRIYVVGGKDQFGRILDTVEYYDLENKVWRKVDKGLCCPRMGAGVTAFGGLLWVAGGFIRPPTEMGCLVRDVECYEPFSDRWLYQISRLPDARVFSKLVVCQDHLYLVGGCGVERQEVYCPRTTVSTLTSINQCLRYDREVNHWTQPHMGTDPGTRHDVALASIDHTVYSVGGLATQMNSALDDVLSYDVREIAWKTLQPIPLRTVGTGLVALPPQRLIEYRNWKNRSVLDDVKSLQPVPLRTVGTGLVALPPERPFEDSD